MTRSVWTRLGLACGATALLLGASPLRAEEGVAFKNMMANMGLIPPEKDPIRYRERAPLVLPPKMELPAPAGPDTLAVNNPAWPKDPDVESKKRRAAEERTPVTYSETRRMSENNPRLTPEEMRSGRSASVGAPLDPKLHRGDNARDVLLLSPQELASMAKKDDDADPQLGNEPARKTLTEPPTGMRRSATGGRIVASNAAPKVDQQQRDANPINWLTRKFSNSEDDE
jgi:hypothetical protein